MPMSEAGVRTCVAPDLDPGRSTVGCIICCKKHPGIELERSRAFSKAIAKERVAILPGAERECD